MLRYLKIFLSVVILFSFNIKAQIFVSPNGDDNNTGTIDKPFKSIPIALGFAQPGDTVYLRGGVYNISATIKPPRSGTAGNLINLWAYPGETPVLDFSGESYSSSSRGFNLSQDYWYFKGLVIRNAGDNGINISGNHDIVENCTLYHNQKQLHS